MHSLQHSSDVTLSTADWVSLPQGTTFPTLETLIFISPSTYCIVSFFRNSDFFLGEVIQSVLTYGSFKLELGLFFLL